MENKIFSRHKRRYGEIFLVVCGVILLLQFISYESITVPEWKIQVVDTQGNPLIGVNVYQTWKHYSFEPSNDFNRDIRVTDQNGYVSFPQHIVRVSLLRRIIEFIGEKLNINPHASFGPHGHVSLSEGGITYAADYIVGKALPSEIIVQK
jgi:hypothetical protein